MKCDMTVPFMTTPCLTPFPNRIMLQTGLLISMSHSWLLLFWTPNTKGNMTNACISSQEASSLSFFSRIKHFLSFPVRVVSVVAVIYSIWSERSLTCSVGGERCGLFCLLLLPSSSRSHSNDNNTPTRRLPVQFIRVILADPIHTQPSQQHSLCSPTHMNKHSSPQAANKTQLAELWELEPCPTEGVERSFGEFVFQLCLQMLK